MFGREYNCKTICSDVYIFGIIWLIDISLMLLWHSYQILPPTYFSSVDFSIAYLMEYILLIYWGLFDIWTDYINLFVFYYGLQYYEKFTPKDRFSGTIIQ